MKLKTLAFNVIIISVYVGLTIALPAISYGPIQLRLAEGLMVLCLYKRKYVITLTLACFLANLVGLLTGSNPMVLDLFVGTLATLISGLLMYQFRDLRLFDKAILSLLVPAIVNGIMVGGELSYYYSVDGDFLKYFVIFGLYVFVGEGIVTVILGMILEKPLSKVIEHFGV